MRISPLDRILLLITSILAGYQISIGIDGHGTFPILAYTVAFGVLLIASLLILIVGLGVLANPLVVVISTILPLSLALGLVWEYLENYRLAYLLLTIVGFLAIVITRAFPTPNKLSAIVLSIVHGIAGVAIFTLPVVLVVTGQVQAGFIWVGAGGALFGAGGLLLSVLKTGRPFLSKEILQKMFPGLLLIMTVAFIFGFSFA